MFPGVGGKDFLSALVGANADDDEPLEKDTVQPPWCAKDLYFGPNVPVTVGAPLKMPVPRRMESLPGSQLARAVVPQPGRVALELLFRTRGTRGELRAQRCHREDFHFQAIDPARHSKKASRFAPGRF